MPPFSHNPSDEPSPGGFKKHLLPLESPTLSFHFTHLFFISFSPASVLCCFLPACRCLFMPTHSRLSSIRDRHLSYHTTQIAAIQEVPFVGCFCSISNVSSTLFMVMGSYFENLVVGILQYVFCMIN